MGVHINRDTRLMAFIMLLSLIPFALVLLLQVFSGPMILIALIVSALSLVSYISYQIVNHRIRNRIVAYLKEEYFQVKLWKKLQKLTNGSLYSHGEPNIEAFWRIFSLGDLHESKDLVSHDKLEQLISQNLTAEEDEVSYVVEEIFSHFDTDDTDRLNRKELEEGCTRCLEKWKAGIDGQSSRRWNEDALDYGNSKEEPKLDILYVLIGILAIYLFAMPFMQSVIQFSNALHIPFLFTSFVVAPFFMKARQVVTFAFWPASRTSSNKNASLTFFELYGGLVMNNLMGLTTLLAIVYIRGLTWAYTAEVVTIIVIGAIQGVFALFRRTYPLWTSIVSFFLYVMTICLFCFYVWGRA